MGFQHPSVLWWLLALLIPLFIHLFNFRRHKVMLFSNVELLKNLQQESNRTKKLKHLLILMSRLLAIFFLVLAFAGPYIKDDDTVQGKLQKDITVYIDNSASMQLRGSEMTLLEEARQKALLLAKYSDLNTRFTLITNDFEPRHNRSLSQEEFMNELSLLQPSQQTVDFGQVIRRNQTRESIVGNDRLMFFLSDFQRTSTQWDDLPADTSLSVFLVPLKSKVKKNIFIDSIWTESPVQQAGMESYLNVRVVNAGDEDVSSVPLKLDINGKQLAVTNVDIASKASALARMQFINFQSGHQQGVVSIQDYPVVFDDEMFFSFKIEDQMKVVELFDAKPENSLSILWENDPNVHYTAIQRLQFDVLSIRKYDLVILNQLESIPTGLQQTINEYVRGGGSLIVLPSSKGLNDFNSLTFSHGFTYATEDTAKSRVFNLETAHPLLNQVFISIPENADFPIVKKHFPMTVTGSSNAFTVARLVNGNPFLLVSNEERAGTVYAFCSPFDPDYTTFTRNALFAPILYRILLMSTGLAQYYYISGAGIQIPLEGVEITNEIKIRVKETGSGFEVIPAIDFKDGKTILEVKQTLKSPAHFEIHVNDSVAGIFSLNPNRGESSLDFLTDEEILGFFTPAGFRQVRLVDSYQNDVSLPITDAVSDKNGSLALIWLVLLFLLAEVLIIRFWN